MTLLFFGMISVFRKCVGHAMMLDGRGFSMPSADMPVPGAHRPHVVRAAAAAQAAPKTSACHPSARRRNRFICHGRPSAIASPRPQYTLENDQTMQGSSQAGNTGQVSPALAAVHLFWRISLVILLLPRSLLDYQLVYFVGHFFGGFQLGISFSAAPEDRRLPQYFIILGDSRVLHDLSKCR